MLYTPEPEHCFNIGLPLCAGIKFVLVVVSGLFHVASCPKNRQQEALLLAVRRRSLRSLLCFALNSVF